MKIENIYQAIGATIRGKRRSLDMAQETLASRVGISRATLANIETGRQRILVHQLYALADALKIDPKDLLVSRPQLSDLTNLSRLPLPSDLNPLQKEQITLLIEMNRPRNLKSEIVSDGKAGQQSNRRPSAKAAR
jgi:transcriptional regulator with XRE-family HTH domain